MISVSEALDIVKDSIEIGDQFEVREVDSARGYILFESVVSPIDMPPFRQSAMDGYALNLGDNSTYHLVGEIKAGDNIQPNLQRGQAVRIFTGAPVPNSANAVIMQEKTSVENNTLIVEASMQPDENIRPMGEQVSNGQIALEKGTLLTPAAIAFLASLGITKVKVHAKPSVAIVVTGNELAEAGSTLSYGQIYESNATMLGAALEGLGYPKPSIFKVLDDYQSTVEHLKLAIDSHEMVLVSGGISVGDYDFVGKALREIGVTELFYKVRQKPGKPLFFGMKSRKAIFALPGNPAAALSCFYMYAFPALERLSGNPDFSLHRIQVPSRTSFQKKGERAQFLKARYINGGVEILDGQSSAMLHTFALSNALVFLPETKMEVSVNEPVEVLLLPLK